MTMRLRNPILSICSVMGIISLISATSLSASVSVIGTNSAIKLGDPVRIVAILTNTSSSWIYAGRTRGPTESGGLDYFIDLRSADGIEVERSRLGKTIVHEKGGDVPLGVSSIKMELNPEEELRENIDLSDLYNIVKPGYYKCRVTRRVALPDGEVQSIESQWIDIHIVS